MNNKLQWEPYLMEETQNVYKLPQIYLKGGEEEPGRNFPDCQLQGHWRS